MKASTRRTNRCHECLEEGPWEGQLLGRDTQHPRAGGLHVAGGGIRVSSDLKGALIADHELPLWASDY